MSSAWLLFDVWLLSFSHHTCSDNGHAGPGLLDTLECLRAGEGRASQPWRWLLGTRRQPHADGVCACCLLERNSKNSWISEWRVGLQALFYNEFAWLDQVEVLIFTLPAWRLKMYPTVVQAPYFNITLIDYKALSRAAHLILKMTALF